MRSEVEGVPVIVMASRLLKDKGVYEFVEAAACGRVVITTDMPGCRDAIEPNISGLLVPARDSIALAQAIKCLLKDNTLRQQMGRAGRDLAEREFSIDKVIAAHIAIYHELLEAGNSE